MLRKRSHLVLTSMVAVGLAVEFLPPGTRATWEAARAKIAAAGAAAARANPGSQAAEPGQVSPASTPAPAGSLGAAPPVPLAATPVPPPLPVCSVVPQGTQCIPHVVKRNESLGGLVSHYLPETVYMRRAELEAAVRQANGIGS